MSEGPLRFANEPKLRKQMRKRGITEEMIREALGYTPTARTGKLGPARMHRSQTTGIVVLVDATTDEIFHVGTARFCMTTREVYVALLDEGIPVWRPASALPVDSDMYVLLRPDDYDPEDEVWEFSPGSVVRCESRTIQDGTIFAAVARVSTNVRQSA